MSFMISRETENVGTLIEVESAFQAITSGGDKPFVTEEELLQVSTLFSIEWNTFIGTPLNKGTPEIRKHLR